MAERQLIVVVEGTAYMSRHWINGMCPYVENIVRHFCDFHGDGKVDSNFELALVVFNVPEANDRVVRRSPWIRDMTMLLQWLVMLSFDFYGQPATGEGLSEALMMFSIDPGTSRKTKHCILVTGSDPHPNPINVDLGSDPVDLVTLAKIFAKCYISLSVISPRSLQIFRDICEAGKPNFGVIYTVEYDEHLVLLSRNFKEACVAFGLVPPTSMPSEAIALVHVPDIHEMQSEFPPDQQIHPFELELGLLDQQVHHFDQHLGLVLEQQPELELQQHFGQIRGHMELWEEVDSDTFAWMEPFGQMEQQQTEKQQTEKQQTTESQDVVTT